MGSTNIIRDSLDVFKKSCEGLSTKEIEHRIVDSIYRMTPEERASAFIFIMALTENDRLDMVKRKITTKSS